jgi:hypothetical protein
MLVLMIIVHLKFLISTEYLETANSKFVSARSVSLTTQRILRGPFSGALLGGLRVQDHASAFAGKGAWNSYGFWGTLNVTGSPLVKSMK